MLELFVDVCGKIALRVCHVLEGITVSRQFQNMRIEIVVSYGRKRRAR